jgi:CheY-like chemotaxis protein
MHDAKRCLLIDDDHDDQLLFSLAIKELSKTIHLSYADSAIIALEKLQEDTASVPDLIFLDLNIPGINGFECLARLKENDKLSHIPVVIYSTSSRAEDVVKTKNLGAFAFITKPNHIRDLTVKLEQFF